MAHIDCYYEFHAIAVFDAHDSRCSLKRLSRKLLYLESGVSKPMIVFVNTDLPLPERSSMTSDSPLNMSKLMLFNIVLSSKDRLKFDIDIMELCMHQNFAIRGEEMQCDDVTWNILNKGMCSFKTRIKTQKFCRNEYNLTGLCNRASCPLANSQYATLKHVTILGICYLYMKVIERSHYPRRLWERIKLSRNMTQAVRQIDDALLHWSEYVRHKCKARLIRIHQYLIRMRKMKLRERLSIIFVSITIEYVFRKPKIYYLSATTKIIPIQRKIERREVRREEKALIAAKLDTAIEKELLNRLREGTYGEIYNFRQDAFNRVLDEQEEVDTEFNHEIEVEEINEDTGIREYVADFEESSDEDGDIEDAEEVSDHWNEERNSEGDMMESEENEEVLWKATRIRAEKKKGERQKNCSKILKALQVISKCDFQAEKETSEMEGSEGQTIKT
ncbi:Protein MAK16 [Dirofilaria immitis]|nr:Protein MAK16 [Dirofilaria immitis]